MSNRYKKVIVFEDDVRFRPYFIQKLNFLMEETKTAIPDWDLMYGSSYLIEAFHFVLFLF